MLQWMAVSVHGRPLHFHAQSDKELTVGWLLGAISQLVCSHQVSVRTIWLWLCEYSKGAPAEGAATFVLEKALATFGAVNLRPLREVRILTEG